MPHTHPPLTRLAAGERLGLHRRIAEPADQPERTRRRIWPLPHRRNGWLGNASTASPSRELRKRHFADRAVRGSRWHHVRRDRRQLHPWAVELGGGANQALLADQRLGWRPAGRELEHDRRR